MPLFLENAHSVATIKHSMNVIRGAVQHLNPGQAPEIAIDQLLFALAISIQWKFPDTHGEGKFVNVWLTAYRDCCFQGLRELARR